MEQLKINDMYEVVVDLNNGIFKCLRYGEEWRNLVGDNLILSMFYKIQELEEKLDRSASTQAAEGLKLGDLNIEFGKKEDGYEI